MTRHVIATAAFAVGAIFLAPSHAFSDQHFPGRQAYGYQWGSSYNSHDWNRLYHYPYVWYPQNFYADGYYQSANDLYYRYPQEMRVPVYNKRWQNYYPKGRRYHQGHHFKLDVF